MPNMYYMDILLEEYPEGVNLQDYPLHIDETFALKEVKSVDGDIITTQSEFLCIKNVAPFNRELGNVGGYRIYISK